jgi:hypothetical protein
LIQLGDQALLGAQHLADLVLADVVDAHRQVAFGQALRHRKGFAHRPGDAARYEPAEDRGQQRRYDTQYDDQPLGCRNQFVGVLAGLVHRVGLELDQCVDGRHVVGLRLAQVTLHQCHDVGLLVGLEQFEELVLGGHVGGT